MPHFHPLSLSQAICRLTYCVLTVSIFFLTICFFFHTLDRILTKFGQKHRLVEWFKSYALFGVKGHVGFTGVKNVLKNGILGSIQQKCLFLLHITQRDHENHAYEQASQSLQLFHQTFFDQRSFEVTGSNSKFKFQMNFMAKL